MATTEQGKEEGRKEPAQKIFAEKTILNVINLILLCHQNYTTVSLVQRESDPER